MYICSNLNLSREHKLYIYIMYITLCKKVNAKSCACTSRNTELTLAVNIMTSSHILIIISVFYLNETENTYYPFTCKNTLEWLGELKKVWSDCFTMGLDPMSFYHPPRLHLWFYITLKKRQAILCMIFKWLSFSLSYFSNCTFKWDETSVNRITPKLLPRWLHVWLRKTRVLYRETRIS